MIVVINITRKIMTNNITAAVWKRKKKREADLERPKRENFQERPKVRLA